MAAKYTLDTNTLGVYSISGLEHAQAHLSDGTTTVFLYRIGSNNHLCLGYVTAGRTGFTQIFDFGVVTNVKATLCVDNANNIFVFYNSNANPGHARSFTKGAGLTWAAQADLTHTLSGGIVFPYTSAVWCNTGGGTNGKGHILVSWPEANNQSHARTVDAGVMLAGAGTLLTGSKQILVSAAQPTSDNHHISANGFGATSGLAVGPYWDGTNFHVGVYAWSVSATGVITWTQLASATPNGKTAFGAKARLARAALNLWAVVWDDAAGSNKLYATRYSASAQLTGPTTYGSIPTGWRNFGASAANWDLAADPTGNKVWVYAQHGTTLTIMARLGISVASGITWDASVTSDDTGLGAGDLWPGLRVLNAPRFPIVDYWFGSFSTPNYLTYGDFSQYNQPPNPPAWVTPASNLTADLSGTYGLQWTFTDPDAGNTQSGMYIRASIDGASAVWWTGAAWSAVETKIVQAGQTYTMPVGAFGNNHYYDLAVATEDNNNSKSAYSPVVRLQGSPPPPTGVTPSTGSTVSTDIPTLGLVRAASPLTVKGRWQLATDAGFTTNVRLITEPDTDFATSGAASEIVLVASQLFQGTWYVRAAVVDQNGVASSWTAGQSFTVSHAPSAVNLTPTGGQALSWGGAGSVTLDWDFSDPSPVDNPTAYQVILERNDTGASVFDTGKVAASATQHNFTLSGTLKDIILRWKIRQWDSDDVVGSYTPYSLFLVQDAPVITITSPADGGTATSPAPTVTWSSAFGPGRSAREFHVVVTRTSDMAVIHDSGWIVSAAMSYTLPTSILVLGQAYTVRVDVRDTNYITGTDTNAFTAEWVPPVGPPKTITNLYESEGHVKLQWQDTAHDPDFVSYRAYRREIGAQAWVLLAEYFVTQATYEYRDYLAESGTQYEYDVVQVVNRFGSLVESNHASTPLTPVSSDYWIIYSNEPTDWAYNLRLAHATADTPVEEYDQEAIALIGRGRHVDFGDRIGFKGTLTIELWDEPAATARLQLLQLRTLKADRRSVWLRNPFGDIWQVVFEDTPFDRMAGVGTREFGTLTMPYVEVAD